MILRKFVGKAVRRIVKDFKQKELIPLKMLFFVQATTICVLYPYLTIHMRELGMTVEETAIMSAVIPIISIVMPPLAGMAADKIGNFKILLSFFSLIGGLVSLLLLLVPAGRIKVTYPERIVLDFGCSSIQNSNLGHLSTRLAESIPCQTSSSNETSLNLEMKLEVCGLACRPSNRSSDVVPQFSYLVNTTKESRDLLLEGRSYVVKFETDTESRSITYNLTVEDVLRPLTKEDVLLRVRKMKNPQRYKRSILRISEDRYFFPSDGLFDLRCRKVRDRGESEEERESPSDFLLSRSVRSGDKPGSDLLCSIHGPGPEDSGAAGDGRSRWRTEPDGGGSPVTNWLQGKRVTLRDVMNDTDSTEVSDFMNVACRKPHIMTEGTIKVSVYSLDPERDLQSPNPIELSRCESRCLMTAKRKEICTNLEKEVEYDPELTFWSYLVVRVLIGVIGSTSYALYEVAVIAILREQKADYGLQKIYFSIGGMIASPLSGLLIDYASSGQSGTDFSPAFYLYGALKFISCFLMLLINLKFKQAATSVVSDFIQIMKNAEVLCLLGTCFVLGSSWGYIESFLFWFLEDLGGSRSLMGITITVSGIAGIPVLMFSGPIIDKVGHANILFIGFVFYAIRLLGYSLIYNPYHCLFFEAMESITSSLAFTAAITYAAKLSTTTTDGSIQGLVGGLYFGVGKGAGSLIGGYLMKGYGTRATFRIFSVGTITIGIMYMMVYHLYLKKLPNRECNDICKKEPKEKAKKVEAAPKKMAEKGMEPEKEIKFDKNDNAPEGQENGSYVKSEDEDKTEEQKPDAKEKEALNHDVDERKNKDNEDSRI